jgi:mono/diheme cytochrome c family protein
MNSSFLRRIVAVWGSVATVLIASHLAAGPIPEPITPSGLQLEIEDFVRIPNSHGGGSVPRMNFLTHAGDGSGRLFVCDERGEIWILQDGAVLPTPFLDVSVARAGSFRLGGAVSGLGLRSMAFHPGYSNAFSSGFGKVYISHIEFSTAGTPNLGPTTLGEFDPDPDPGGCPDIHGVVGEWSVDPANANRLLPGSYREILRMLHPCWDHSVKMVGFNPLATPGDSDYELLYVAVGDAGSQNEGSGQDLKTPLGSILRINPLATESSPYSVPPDNPFVSDPNALDELYAIGFRNPHRFTFTEGNGGQTRMILSDIGHSNVEEVNEIEARGNYGWRVREGTFVNTAGAISPLPPDDAQFGFVYPVAQYDHDEGRAIVGGFVYQGMRAPHLVGQYIFGDFNNGRFFHVHVDDLVPGTQAVIHELTIVFFDGVDCTATTFLSVVNSSRADSRFGLGEDGELYILNKRDGLIYRLAGSCEPVPVPPKPPKGTIDVLPVGDGSIVIDGSAADWPLEQFDTLAQQPLFPDGQNAESTDAAGDHIVFDVDRVGFFNSTAGNAFIDGANDMGSGIYMTYDANNLYLLEVRVDESIVRNLDAGGCGNWQNDGFEIFLDPLNDTNDCITDFSFPNVDTATPNVDDVQMTFAVNENFGVDAGNPDSIGGRQQYERGGLAATHSCASATSLYQARLDSLGIPTEQATTYADMRDAVPQTVLDEIMGFPVVTALSGYVFELLVPFGSIAPGFDPTLNNTMGFELFWRDKDGAENVHWAAQAQSTEVPCTNPGASLFHGGNWSDIVFSGLGDPIRGGRMYDNWWAVGGVAAPEGEHPLYPEIGEQAGSATFRCKECHGWDYKGADGAYATGPHFTGIPGLSGSTMTVSQKIAVIKKPPGDGTQGTAVNGHGFGALGLSDDEIRDLAAFLQEQLIDTDGFIDEGATFFQGDPLQGQVNYSSGGCVFCHGSDGTSINFGTPEEPEWVGTIAVANPWKLIHKIRLGQPGTAMPSWLQGGGLNQGAADIGRYLQEGDFPTGRAWQLAGDCNQDGGIDLSDGVAFLQWFFLGIPLPVAPGSELCLTDPAGATAVGLRIMDWNGDVALDLSDGTGLLTWFFGGTAEHVLGQGCVLVQSPDCVSTCVDNP